MNPAKDIYYLITGRWRVIRTIWPYPHGYGTYNERKSMLLDTGLSKAEAQERCAELNKNNITHGRV